MGARLTDNKLELTESYMMMLGKPSEVADILHHGRVGMRMTQCKI